MGTWIFGLICLPAGLYFYFPKIVISPDTPSDPRNIFTQWFSATNASYLPLRRVYLDIRVVDARATDNDAVKNVGTEGGFWVADWLYPGDSVRVKPPVDLKSKGYYYSAIYTLTCHYTLPLLPIPRTIREDYIFEFNEDHTFQVHKWMNSY